MKERKAINREIGRLAWPSILTNISVPLLGLVDTAISGHLGAGSYLGAVAVGSMMLNVAYWLFGFLRMGTTGLTAEALGARDNLKIRETFTRSLTIALITGLAVIIFRHPLSWLMLKIISPSPEVHGLAMNYFVTAVLGAPALLSMQTANGWMVGMQSTSRPMVVTIVMNVLNIVLSLTLVYGCGWGFRGIAWGTCISQWGGFLLSMLLARKLAPEGKMLAPLKSLKGAGMKKYFTVNVNLFFRSFCVMAVSLALNAYGARNGDIYLAMNAVMMQFFFFFSYFIDGLAFASEAMVGKFSGAHDRENLRLTLGSLGIWGGALTLLFTLLYLVGWRFGVDMLTDVMEVRTLIGSFAVIILLIPVSGAAAFVLDGIFIGLTDTGAMFRATLLSTIVFFMIASANSFSGSFPGDGMTGNMMLWVAYLTYLFLRGVLLGIALPRQLRKLEKRASVK